MQKKELKIKTIIHTVNDGVELIEYLSNEGNILPQLIFLNLNMLRKNGLKCLKEIKGNHKKMTLPLPFFQPQCLRITLNKH